VSYSRFGLGQAPAAPVVLRPFESLDKEGVRYGVTWGLVSDDPTLEQIKKILVQTRALPAGESVRGTDGKIRDDGAFIDALRNLWIRASQNPAWWPSAFKDTDTNTINYNFGPTNGDGTQLRINQAFWDVLQRLSMTPERPWMPFYTGKENEIGHVRVRLNDQLYRNTIQNRLIELGYLDPSNVTASIADGSTFSEALKRYYTEAREQRLPVGSWAGWTETGGCGSYDVFGACQNYGPATDGDQIRLHTDLIDSLVNKRHNPRAAYVARGLQAGVMATRTRPPLYGSLPGESAPVSLLSKAAMKNVSRVSTLDLSTLLKK
jgi:hypothetical protein